MNPSGNTGRIKKKGGETQGYCISTKTQHQNAKAACEGILIINNACIKTNKQEKKKGKRKKKNEDGKQNAYDEHGKDSES